MSMSVDSLRPILGILRSRRPSAALPQSPLDPFTAEQGSDAGKGHSLAAWYFPMGSPDLILLWSELAHSRS